MRDIRFRGKRKHGPEILTGDLNHIYGGVYIFPRNEDNTPSNSPDWFEVDPETVGQSTGRKDLHGNTIFENDIVKDSDRVIYMVLFYQDNLRFMLRKSMYKKKVAFDHEAFFLKLEIIGSELSTPDLWAKYYY